MKKKFSIEAVLVSLLVILVFIPIYSHLILRFNARDSYYSHGFLIPLVVGYLVFKKRNILSSIEAKPCFFGLFVFVFGLGLHLISLVLKVNFTSYLAVPVVIAGILLYLKGVKFTKELLFPLCFLIFMLPLPAVMIVGMSYKLKIFAAGAATFLGNSIGIKSSLSGSTIYYPGGTLLVGDPCSGLRSLISFIALGALFTQFTKAAIWRKLSLFCLTIPIALISNFLRITFLLWVSFAYGKKAASGFVHDFSGYMVFVVGFLGLMLVSKILRCQLSTENI